MDYKVCSRCKQSLPATVYWFPTRKKKNNQYGFYLRECCRKCTTARKVESQRRNPESARVRGQRWRDNGGSEQLREKYANDAEFRKERIEYSREYQKKNPEKVNAKNAKWRKENPEKARAIDKRGYLRHRESILQYRRLRNNQRGEKIEAWKKQYYSKPEVRERRRMWGRMNYDPAKAKAKAAKRRALGAIPVELVRQMIAEQENKCAFCSKDMGNKPTLEHIIPVSKGGTNAPENLCMTCTTCNYSRGNKDLDEWIATRGW